MSPISILQQDNAAGGSHLRDLRMPDGTVVRASVSVRRFARTQRQQYAYLQFKYQSKTVTRYIGKVTSEKPEDALSKGWALLKSRKLAEENGWKWVSKARW